MPKQKRTGHTAPAYLLTVIAALMLTTGAPAAGRNQGTIQGATMTRLFAPVDIGADLSTLHNSELEALRHIVEAARVMDGLFLQQVWAGNPSMVLALLGDTTAVGQARLGFFLLNKGPWSRIENNRAFIPGAPPKPEAANFYPGDSTRDEIAAWFDTLPPNDHDAATGFFTTIRREPIRGLISVPYSVEYQGPLALAANHLQAAARATTQPTLRHYLETRADAFLSDDYYESDVAWMELDASLSSRSVPMRSTKTYGSTTRPPSKHS